MNYKENPIWKKLESCSFDSQGSTVRFHEMLARRGKWSTDFTTEVIEDYRKFLFLAATTKEILIPPPAVDLAWDINIHYFKSDWNELSKDIQLLKLRRIIPDSEDNKEPQWSYDNYNRTLELYHNIFHSWPDGRIWPTPREWFHPEIWIRGKSGKSLIRIPVKPIYVLLIFWAFASPLYTSFKWSLIPMGLVPALMVANGKLYGVRRYTWDGNGVTYYE
ncbi:MAG: hypothetical protein J7578_24815 [Chitinophagaceae bacterium]|nr:hypothetical protein [Chitinophagaceae bacterium]